MLDRRGRVRRRSASRAAPRPPAAPLAPPDADPRPLVPPAASRRWWSIVADVDGARGRVAAARRSPRLATCPPTSSSVCCAPPTRRRALGTGRARSADRSCHGCSNTSRAARRRPRGAPTTNLATSCRHSPSHPSSPACSTPARDPSSGGARRPPSTARSDPTHRPVLINFVARARVDTLQPLATALADSARPAGGRRPRPDPGRSRRHTRGDARGAAP